MNGKEIFPTLIDRGQSSVNRFLHRIGKKPSDVFIVFRQDPAGYLVFDSYKKFLTYSAAQPVADRLFHEVITQGPQKIRFDIDAKLSDLVKIPIVEVQSDIDPALRKALVSSNKQFEQLCLVVANSISDLYLFLYGKDPDICVCESHDNRGLKFSRHFILTGPGMSSSFQVKAFAKEVISMINLQYRRFVDDSIYKRTQNFRLVGSRKKQGNRVKEIITNHSPDDTIIGICDSILPDLAPDEDPRPRAVSGDLDEILQICEKANLLQDHQFRCCKDNMYLFDRKRSSKCKFCNRTHDSDNTLVVTLSERDEYIDVYQKCRRKIDKSELIGSFISSAPKRTDDEPTVQRKKTSKLQKDIQTAGDELESNLFSQSEGIIYDEPSLRDFTLHDTLVIHAAMKMGKTKKLRKYLDQYFPSNDVSEPIIRFISFRQTFSANIKQNFPDFAMYNEEQGSILNSARLIIQVESLHRLEIEGEAPDLLILDECESIIEQFDSGLLRRFSLAVAKFVYLLKHSKHVICMDANITSRTENILSKMRNKPVYYHRNVYKNASDHTVHITSNKYAWVSAVNSAVENGEKIAIPMSSLDEANALHKLLTTRHKDATVALYSSETPAAVKKEHFAAINDWWSQYDVVIYTPTVSAGVSFEKKHFDKVFGFFIDQSCNDLTCIQMLGRIRDVGSKQTYIYLSSMGGSHPTTIEDIRDQFYERRQCLFNGGEHIEYDGGGNIIYHTTPYFHIWLENIRARNMSKNDFAKRITCMLKGSGANVIPMADIKIELDELIELRAEYTNNKNEIKSSKHAQIARCPDIEEEELNTIINAMTRQDDVAAEDVNKYRKHVLREVYKFYEEITPEFVATYMCPKRKQQYKNLCAVADCSDESLSRIQEMERAAYSANMANAEEFQYHDIHRTYYYRKHYIAINLMRECGWRSLIGDQVWRHTAVICDEMNPVQAKKLIGDAIKEFELQKQPIPQIAESLVLLLLRVTNQVIGTMYDARILGKQSMHILRASEKFTYNTKNRDKPIIRFTEDTFEEYVWPGALD